MLRYPLAFAAGLALALGARVTPEAAPAPEPAPEAAPAPEPAPPSPTGLPTDPAACADLQAEVHDRLDALQIEADRLAAAATVLAGEPVPWPDDAPEAVREPAVRARLEAAAAAIGDGFALRELRCDEYPCIAIYHQLGEEDGARVIDALAEGPAAVGPLGGWSGEPYFAAVFTAEAPDQALTLRLWHRWTDFQAEVGTWP